MSAHLANIHRLIKKPAHWGWVGDMYLAGNDCGIAMRLLDGQEYEPESRRIWARLCKGAELVIDIGAHTGRYSLDAWQAGAKGVLSVEPYPLNFARLTMNLHHSGFPTANCAFCAAHDENTIVQITSGNDPHYCSAGARIGPSRDWRKLKVEARRLDGLLNANQHAKVSVIKIDTEGNVGRILKGMPDILSYRPDLILECIEHGMGEILKPLGYKFYKINEKDPMRPLTLVDDLIPDDPVNHESPNRYATVE